ncbi:hypothetical protein ACHAXT_000979 [Thalassiosira profunda]
MARKPRTSPAAKPKRVRRKCSAPGCANRVVQGGVCVTHGAKRKLCAHPGCAKAVKLAGFCSAHGPARRKCGHEGCTRVAVQGGRCLSHGAKRRVCCYPLKNRGERCDKNAIVGGMCKKHYDRVQEANGMLEIAGGVCQPISESGPYEEGDARMGYEAEQPPTVAVAPKVHKKRARKNPPPQHQRGLSIFEDMATMNAIISSGSKEQASAQAYSQPLKQPYKAPAATQATKTPNTQVTFADCSSGHTVDSAKVPPPTCLRNANCTCDACRSPTLAIFEKMIQASHELESGDFEKDPRFAGLSPPKLSPRKSSQGNGGKGEATPKNVSFLPEEPTSSGSVVRKVSSNNIAGQAPEAAAQEYHAYSEHQERDASHALAALAKNDPSVSRTVSHDHMDHGQYHYGGGYGQYAAGGRHSPPQYGHPSGRRTPPGYHQAGQYGGYGPPPPYQGHHQPYAPQHPGQHPTAADFRPPQTPALQEHQRPAPAETAVVSHHSHNEGHASALLPRRREDVQHLFIPKEV